MSDVTEILRKLVKYDTRTNESLPGPEVKQLLENEIEPVLVENGFEVEYFESCGHHSLFAVKNGSSPSILYSGHVDVVPWDDRWNTDPQEMVAKVEAGEEVLVGRGVTDMKGGVAAMIAALPELAKCKSKILCCFSGDEINIKHPHITNEI